MIKIDKTIMCMFVFIASIRNIGFPSQFNTYFIQITWIIKFCVKLNARLKVYFYLQIMPFNFNICSNDLQMKTETITTTTTTSTTTTTTTSRGCNCREGEFKGTQIRLYVLSCPSLPLQPQVLGFF